MKQEFHTYITKLIFLLSCLSLITISTSVFVVDRHVAIMSVSIIIGLVCSFLLIVLKQYPMAVPFKILLPFMGIVICFAFSLMLHEENIKIIFLESRKKIIWIIIPIIFFFLPNKSKNIELRVLILFNLSSILIAIWSIYNSLVNYSPQERAYIDSSNILNTYYIPFNISYHTLGISLTLGLIFCLFYIINFSGKSRIFPLFLILIDLFFIHVISSRSAMLACYLSTLAFFVSYIKNYNNSKILTPIIIVTFLSSLIIIIVCYINIEGFQNRIKHTKKEITYLIDTPFNKIDHKGTFTARIISFKNYSQLLTKNITKGIGSVNYEKKLDDYFEKMIYNNDLKSNTNKEYPANQFYRYCLSIGLPLTIAFTIFLFCPLFIDENYKKNILLCCYLTVFIYCMTETPLDTTMPFYLCIVSISMALRIGYASQKWIE